MASRIKPRRSIKVRLRHTATWLAQVGASAIGAGMRCNSVDTLSKANGDGRISTRYRTTNALFANQQILAADPLLEPNVVIGLVFSVLLRRIASMQYDQMVRSRRSPIRELWMWR